MASVQLTLTETLPLTCSRTGTCCFGKAVWLNPWELASLAAAKGVSTREFRNHFCDFGGIRLKFNGVSDKNGASSCGLYSDGFGCSVHSGRPLACRLFPLGLMRQGEERYYMYNGPDFPCMNGCPEVSELPHMSVGDYIEVQKSGQWELAQDLYLAVLETIADGAFALLIESGLAASGDRKTLAAWRTMGEESASQLARRIGSKWIDRLMIPEIEWCEDPVLFVQKHHDLIQSQAQSEFGRADSKAAFSDSSSMMMALALHLGRALGANPADLTEQWIAAAKEHGALE